MSSPPPSAVGGIDGPARARDVALAGGDAVAVIRAAWQPADPGAAAVGRELRH